MKTINTKLSKIIAGVLMVSAPALSYAQTTQIQSQYCGSTLTTLDQNIWADKVTDATNYEFKIVDVNDNTTFTKIKGNQYPIFRMTYISGARYDRTYNIYVRPFINGAWGSYGSACAITTPAFPKTQLTAEFCNTTVRDMDDTISANAIMGASDYEWKFVNGTTVFKTKGNKYSALLLFNVGLTYETTYKVQIRAKVGGYWGDFGPECTLTTPDFPLTKLTDDFCDNAVYGKNAIVHAETVSGAMDYEWKFKDMVDGSVYVKRKGNKYSNLDLSSIPGLRYKRDYEVQIKSNVGGYWSDYGQTCGLRILDIPPTQLTNEYCGYAMNSLDEFIWANKIEDASDYGFEFTDEQTGEVIKGTKGNKYPVIQLTNIEGLTYGKTYKVRVRAMIEGSWGPYGAVCLLTTPTFPVTELTDAFCGATVSKGSTIYANAVAGASNYEWMFSNKSGVVTKIKNNQYPNLELNYKLFIYNGLTTGTWTVQVRAEVGGSWGVFGPGCELTITEDGSVAQAPAERKAVNTAAPINDTPAQEKALSIGIYPNPSLGNSVNLNLSNIKAGYDDIKVELADISGKIVYSKQLNNNGENINANLTFEDKLSSGMYIVTITAGNDKFNHKMIVK